MLSFKIKKLGSYWYPDINHAPNQIYTFDEKLNKYFSSLDIYERNELIIEFEQWNDIIQFDDNHDVPNILYFDESDIVKYLMTTEDFNLHFMFNRHVFEISSDLYCLLEENFNFNFHKEMYSVHVY